MTPEKQEELVNRYPKIFSVVKHFECGDGWYDIVDRLCANIENVLKSKTYGMSEEDCLNHQVVAVQVKEKFGGLRFYIDGVSFDEIQGMISMAESMSFKVCEDCGNRGHKQPGAWIRTLCDPCQEGRATRKFT